MDEIEDVASQPQELSKPKLLFGEGKDEVAVFTALLKHLSIADIQVEDSGGKDKLLSVIESLSKRPGFSNLISLGITRDADNNSANAFKIVFDALTRSGLSAPQASGGVATGTPNVGVMIMPDGVNAGMLEDLCLSALQNDSILLCVDEYFDCVKSKTNTSPDNPSKARIYAWLSAQKKSDLRLGEAAKRGYLDWNNPAFDLLKQFLLAL